MGKDLNEETVLISEGDHIPEAILFGRSVRDV